MSTVLWANYLVDGAVTCDEADKYALYRFAKKLDALCAEQGLAPFSSAFDMTDVRFNLDEIELPPGMESTGEVMAVDGNWIDANDALVILRALLETIRARKTKFGLIGNAHDEVVAELLESIEFAEQAAGRSAKFNFSVVT